MRQAQLRRLISEVLSEEIFCAPRSASYRDGTIREPRMSLAENIRTSVMSVTHLIATWVAEQMLILRRIHRTYEQKPGFRGFVLRTGSQNLGVAPGSEIAARNPRRLAQLAKTGFWPGPGFRGSATVDSVQNAKNTTWPNFRCASIQHRENLACGQDQPYLRFGT